MDNLRDIIIEACQDTSLIEVEIEGLADKLETALTEIREKAAKWDGIQSMLSGECIRCPAISYCVNNIVGPPCEILQVALKQPADEVKS